MGGMKKEGWCMEGGGRKAGSLRRAGGLVCHVPPHPDPLPWGEGTAVGWWLEIREACSSFPSSIGQACQSHCGGTAAGSSKFQLPSRSERDYGATGQRRAGNQCKALGIRVRQGLSGFVRPFFIKINVAPNNKGTKISDEFRRFPIIFQKNYETTITGLSICD
jgi:hypothetical protein